MEEERKLINHWNEPDRDQELNHSPTMMIRTELTTYMNRAPLTLVGFFFIDIFFFVILFFFFLLPRDERETSHTPVPLRNVRFL